MRWRSAVCCSCADVLLSWFVIDLLLICCCADVLYLCNANVNEITRLHRKCQSAQTHHHLHTGLLHYHSQRWDGRWLECEHLLEERKLQQPQPTQILRHLTVVRKNRQITRHSSYLRWLLRHFRPELNKGLNVEKVTGQKTYNREDLWKRSWFWDLSEKAHRSENAIRLCQTNKPIIIHWINQHNSWTYYLLKKSTQSCQHISTIVNTVIKTSNKPTQSSTGSACVIINTMASTQLPHQRADIT